MSEEKVPAEQKEKVEEKKKKDKISLKDLPGVGAATAEKLNDS